MIKQFKIFLISSVSTFLFTNLQCSGPTGPPPVKPNKDPRTYSWTIDTIKASYLQLYEIWGSSANNVYFGGNNSGYPGCLWHYDGNKYEVINLPENKPYEINGIYGFSSGDVWVVGEKSYYNSGFTDSSFICHYNGYLWQQYFITGGGRLRAIWGSTPNDIWAVGSNTLLHFNGASWVKNSFYIPPQGVQLASITGLSSDEVYMTGYRNDVVPPLDTTFYYLYYYNGNQWLVADSSYKTYSSVSDENAWKFGIFLKTISGNIYSAGDGLFRKDADNWIVLNNDEFILNLGGNDSGNLFAVGSFGKLYHYNGKDWENIIIRENFNSTIYYIWTDGSEAFLATEGPYVIHGK